MCVCVGGGFKDMTRGVSLSQSLSLCVIVVRMWLSGFSHSLTVCAQCRDVTRDVSLFSLCAYACVG